MASKKASILGTFHGFKQLERRITRRKESKLVNICSSTM
jgi:hypothetical protein